MRKIKNWKNTLIFYKDELYGTSNRSIFKSEWNAYRFLGDMRLIWRNHFFFLDISQLLVCLVIGSRKKVLKALLIDKYFNFSLVESGCG